MKYDFKTSRWTHDIHSFSRWKTFLERLNSREGEWYTRTRARIRGYMRDIQKRWPQYIKEDEIS